MDHFSSQISTTIEHRLVILDYAVDVVRFGFVVQNSISPLDLALLEKPMSLNSFSGSVLEILTSTVLDSFVQYPKYLINSEEKCRKILSVTRDFLYRLHLDLPKKREYSLKEGPEPENMFADSFRRHIGKITAHRNFHYGILSSLVKEAIKRSDKKLKLIKWLVTFDAATENVRLDYEDVNYFASCMYPGVTETSFVNAFLKKCDLELWMMQCERPKLLEYFLHHLRQSGGNLKYNEASEYAPIDGCVMRLHFLNIAPLLKYQDAPRVPPRPRFPYAMPCYRINLGFGVVIEAEKRMSRRRFYLMSQLMYIDFKCPRHFQARSSAAECLRLLWNSIPDAFFSFEEIETTFEGGVSYERIQDLYRFYSGAVGLLHSRAEPRPLKHLCRPTVRRMLWERNCWIPEGIRLTGLPKVLQAFLNLEA